MNDTDDNAHRIVALLDAAAEAPHPADAGLPPEAGEAIFDDDSALPRELDVEEIGKVDPAALASAAEEPQNDTGNGQRLLAHFGRDILNVREVGWHAWCSSHWRREGGDEFAIRCAHRTAERIALEADLISATASEKKTIERGEDAKREFEALERRRADWTDDDKRKAAALMDDIEDAAMARDALTKRRISRRKFAVSSGNSARIKGMLDMAEPYRTVPPDTLDGDKLAFNVRNGTLRFVAAPDPECPDPDADRVVYEVTLSPPRPEDHIGKLAPVDYVPDVDCPRFSAFLTMVQPNARVREFLQRWHGYALTALTGEQCLVFNYGLGANGKSTFIDIISRIMGDYALTMAFESLAGDSARSGNQATPDLARLPGARLVRASEPERNVHLKESLIKSLTGGEPILVRHNFKDFFEVVPVFKLSLSGNEKPEISGVDHGIWRRVRLVPWTYTIPEALRRPINDVLAEFWEERSGILNWLVAGALSYLRDGLPVPPEIAAATAEYREEMDPVGSFCEDCVERVPASDSDPSWASARDVYLGFTAWCDANSVRPWKEKSFAKAMGAKGFLKDRQKNVRRYLHVRLHDVPARPSRTTGEPPHPADEEVPL